MKKLFLAALAHFLLPGERLARRALLGMLLGFGGVALIFSQDFARLGGAQVASRPLPEGRGGEALDVFFVRDRNGRAITDDARWRRIVADLERVMAGLASVEDVVEARSERSTLAPRLRPPVATEIEVDNQVSTDFTVIDIYTLDRLGVLHAICSTLERLGLDVGFSKVSTEAHRVADVFYVRDREHLLKITDPDRLAEIERELRAALEKVPES